MKILSIGNSFAQDTMEHLPSIAKDLGIDCYFGYLYIGGCPIDYHYINAVDDIPAYRYCTSSGGEWVATERFKISDAIADADWDFINIQHGSKDGRCYTKPIFYKRLPDLAEFIRKNAGEKAKITFNMTWVADPENNHHEMVEYFGNDGEKMFDAVVDITRELVAKTPGIDIISPTGAAVQIARERGIADITRDFYHVSYGFGRYMAGLTFLKALTGVDITKVKWAPEGVSDEMRETAVSCALQSIQYWENQKR